MTSLSLRGSPIARVFAILGLGDGKSNPPDVTQESDSDVSEPAGIGGRLKSLLRSIAWQEFEGPQSVLPPERSQPGPFGSLGQMAGSGASSGTRSVTRAAASQMGALTSITINDRSLRVLVTRGNRILHWSSADLPAGIVEDGIVRDSRRFTSALRVAVLSLHEGSHLEHRKIGLVVSGRNTVQGRFVLLDTGDESMESAVLNLAAERMAVTPSDIQLDWDAKPLEPAEDADDQPSARSSSNDDDDADPFEVYALGIFNNVLESNLRPIKQAGMRTVSVSPKSLSLAASVAEESAIIVDIERELISVIIIKQGLPEVVRDMHSTGDVNVDQWGKALSAHIERSVEFHDMLNPRETIGPETPVFLTGRGADTQRARTALIERRYNVVSIPDVLDAPEGFPASEMAANVGVAVLRGKKPWQRSSVPSVDRPSLQFVPAAYEPRALPVKPLAASAAAAVFAVGLAAGYEQVSEVQQQRDEARVELVNLERQLDLRSNQMRQLVRDQALVSVVRTDAEAVLSTSERIRDRDGGFSTTLDTITGSLPEGVSIDEVDDDGHLVAVNATAPTYAQLLDFTRSLEEAQGILDVRVTNIGSAGNQRVSAEEELYGLLPDLLPGGGDEESGLAEISGVTESMPILELELTR
jgi:hypothetical protein